MTTWTPTTCDAEDCDQLREPGKLFCSAHTPTPTKGEVKRLEAQIVGSRARSQIGSARD